MRSRGAGGSMSKSTYNFPSAMEADVLSSSSSHAVPPRIAPCALRERRYALTDSLMSFRRFAEKGLSKAQGLSVVFGQHHGHADRAGCGRGHCDIVHQRRGGECVMDIPSHGPCGREALQCGLRTPSEPAVSLVYGSVRRERLRVAFVHDLAPDTEESRDVVEVAACCVREHHRSARAVDASSQQHLSVRQSLQQLDGRVGLELAGRRLRYCSLSLPLQGDRWQRKAFPS